MGHPTIVLAGALVALLLMVVVVGTVPEKADAAGRYKIITKSFTNPTNISLLDELGPADPYPSNIDASGFRQGSIRDVNLILWDFSHTFPDDIDMLLVHRGRNRTVMSDAGGSDNVSQADIRLDDEAVAALPDETSLFGDRWKPANYAPADTFPAPAPSPPNAQALLSGFDGANPNGTWSLYVLNDLDIDPGQFEGGWTLVIKARVLRG